MLEEKKKKEEAAFKQAGGKNMEAPTSNKIV
jgi:hypothetical protein